MARSARSKRRFAPSSLTLDSRPSLFQFLKNSAYFHRAAAVAFTALDLFERRRTPPPIRISPPAATTAV
jgi:hypothetical protein